MITGAVLLLGLLFGGAVMVIGVVRSDRWVHGLAGSAALVSVAFGLNVMASQWFA